MIWTPELDDELMELVSLDTRWHEIGKRLGCHMLSAINRFWKLAYRRFDREQLQ